MKKTKERIVYSGQWLSVKEITFIGKDGRELHWEAVERTNNPAGLVVVSRLVPSRRVILIKQYRPAIDNYVIGFPAGLAEKDAIGEEALRELKEETGYQGRVVRISPPLKSNPALMDDHFYVVVVEVDEMDSINRNPRQTLEQTEDIEVLLVKEEEIPAFLCGQIEKGVEIGVGPWYAFAFNFHQK
jgi:ADP-ribose pyrophosphatase